MPPMELTVEAPREQAIGYRTHRVADRRETRVRTLISERSGRTGPKVVDRIWAALGAQTVTVAAEATWGETIRDLTSDLDRIIAQRDDPARLAAYAGLAPVDRQSGRSHTTRRSRGGNHRLKDAMFIAAFVATRYDPDARAYYQHKRAQGKTQRRGHLRRPPTLQRHPRHAKNPNPLPTP